MKWIPLHPSGQVLVDDDDYDKLAGFHWYVDCRNVGRYPGFGTIYAYRTTMKNGVSEKHQMHREIMNAPDVIQVDHINGNGLDNRRSNLRLATTQKNAFNRRKPTILNCTSIFKGVLQRKGTDYWLARIKYNDKHVELGRFPDEKEAAAAYNFASRIFFGEYRKENEGVDELSEDMKIHIFDKCIRKIHREGWNIETTEFKKYVNLSSADYGRAFSLQ